MLHHVTDPKCREILLSGFIRHSARSQRIKFPNHIQSLFARYFEDEQCSMRLEIKCSDLLASNLNSIASKSHSMHPDVRHYGSPLCSFAVDDTTFSVYLLKTDDDGTSNSCTSIFIVATFIPRFIDSYTVYCRFFCPLTCREHKVLSDIVIVGDCISWNDSGLDTHSQSQSHSDSIIPIHIEFDILSIKYCTFDFKHVQLPSNNMMLEFEICGDVLQKYVSSKKTFYSKPSKDGLWCLVFTSLDCDSGSVVMNEYMVSLQLLGLPSMIGSMMVSMICTADRQQGTGSFTFSYEEPICQLPSIRVDRLWRKSLMNPIHIALNLSIQTLYDVKRNLILPHQWKEHGVGIGHYSDKISTILPPKELRTINGKYEWDLVGDDELADFLKWPNGEAFEPRYVSCVALGFMCSLYPNGMTFKHDGYVQFGLRSVCIPPDIQSFVIYFRVYCTDTATEYQDIRVIKCSEFTLKWPAKLLPIETLRDHVIHQQQFTRNKSIHFGVEIKVLKVMKKNMAREQIVARPSARCSPQSPGMSMNNGIGIGNGNGRRVQSIYYLSTKRTKMQNKFKFKWGMDHEKVLRLRKLYPSQSFYSETFNNYWKLRVFPNGTSKKTKGKVRAALMLLSYPKKVNRLKCHVVFGCKYQLQNKRKSVEYAMDHTFVEHEDSILLWPRKKVKSKRILTEYLFDESFHDLVFTVEIVVIQVFSRGTDIGHKQWKKHGVIDPVRGNKKKNAPAVERDNFDQLCGHLNWIQFHEEKETPEEMTNAKLVQFRSTRNNLILEYDKSLVSDHANTLDAKQMSQDVIDAVRAFKEQSKSTGDTDTGDHNTDSPESTGVIKEDEEQQLTLYGDDAIDLGANKELELTTVTVPKRSTVFKSDTHSSMKSIMSMSGSSVTSAAQSVKTNSSIMSTPSSIMSGGRDNRDGRYGRDGMRDNSARNLMIETMGSDIDEFDISPMDDLHEILRNSVEAQWTITGAELDKFVQCAAGKKYDTKYFGRMRGLQFCLTLFPNGSTPDEQGDVALWLLLNDGFPPHIERVEVLITAECKQTATVTKKIESISNSIKEAMEICIFGNGMLTLDECPRNNDDDDDNQNENAKENDNDNNNDQNGGNGKVLDFRVRIEILRILYNDRYDRDADDPEESHLTLTSDPDEATNSVVAAKKVDYFKDCTMDAAPYYEWDIDDDLLEEWSLCRNGASWWSEDFGDCWTLQIFPNGMLQQDVGRVVLQLMMVRMPPKVASLRAHVVLSSNYMRIRTEGVMVFSYQNHSVCVWRDGSFPTKWIRHRIQNYLWFKAEIFITEVMDRNGVAVHERAWNRVGILSTASLSMQIASSNLRFGSNRPSFKYNASNRLSAIAPGQRLSSAFVAASNNGNPNRISLIPTGGRRSIYT